MDIVIYFIALYFLNNYKKIKSKQLTYLCRLGQLTPMNTLICCICLQANENKYFLRSRDGRQSMKVS